MFKVKGLGVRNTIESAKLQDVIEGFSHKTTVSLSKTKNGLNFYNEGSHVGYIRFSKGVRTMLADKVLSINQLVKAAQEQELVSKPFAFTRKNADGSTTEGEVPSFMTPQELRSAGISVADLVAKATPLAQRTVTTELVF